MRFKPIIFFIVLFSFTSVSMAQFSPETKAKIKRYKKLLKTAKHDTTRVAALFNWDQLIYLSDPKLDVELNRRIEKICSTNLKEKNISKKEKKYFNERLCSALNNIGLFYRDIGNYPKALEYYNRGLLLAEKINSQVDISNLLNNIGIVYIDTDEKDKAIGYLNKSFKIALEMGDSSGVASSYNNIGIIYMTQKKYDISFEYHKKALELRKKLGDKFGEGASLMNIGLYYQNIKQYTKAEQYFMDGIKTGQSINNQKTVASGYSYLGALFLEKGDKANALKYYEITLINAQESGEALALLSSSRNLFNLYEEIGNTKKALEMHIIFIAIRDSLDLINAKKESARIEFQHEYEKRAAADSVHNLAEKKLHQTRLDHEKKQKIYLYIGLGLALFFGIFMFSRFRITHRQKITIQEQKSVVEQQKLIVEDQKHIVEEKQREVMASIEYAKRIQHALLPSKKYVDKNLERLKGEKI